MKKFICVLLVAISISMIALISCENDKFVEVYRIDYNNTTIQSMILITYDESERTEITEEEYAKLLNKSYKYAPKEKNVFKQLLKQLKVGDFVGEYNESDKYYKYQIATVYYTIVKVKFLSDREYMIKTNNGTERITSDNFKVIYFN